MFFSATEGWTIRKVMEGRGSKSKRKKKFQGIVNEQIYSYGFWPKKKLCPREKKILAPYVYKKKILHLLKSPPAHHSSNGPSLRPITYFSLVS